MTAQSDLLKDHIKRFKSYWNDELNQFWKEKVLAEKHYLNCKGPASQKKDLCNIYKSKRKTFDRKLRYYERQYNKRNIFNIENLSSSSPHNFWKTLNKQTRVARSSVSSMIYDNHDNMFLTSDEDAVRDKWKNDFSSLYNAALISPHDEQYTQLINMKEDVEHNMLQHDYHNNNFLNSNISYDEIEKCIGRLKPDKASGYDGICNEVLCKPQITYVLYKLFPRIFGSGKIPSLWKRCNITPVPKSAMKDPHVPINYRGISLLSCVGKMYSSSLSNIILFYCELCNILVDEQNVFRKNRSCNDHIFSLSSTCIIRNRLNNGKPTFAAFLDMEKAFDKVDRNQLLLRLLQYGIDDKMYYSI